jgi:hypothetical protein
VAILVDDAVWPWRGRRWAHLVSDTSIAELRAFADALGIDRRLFQGDHYDIPEELRVGAVAAGAGPVSSRELVRRLRASGLRLTAAQRRQLAGQVPAGGGVEPLVEPVGDVQTRAVEEPAQEG